MKGFHKVLYLLTFFLFLFFLPRSVKASEGTIELKSTTNDDFRCFVVSIQMTDLNYRILVTCRDLLYPAGDDIFTYMLWDNPVEGGNPVKLGELGFGRAEFSSKKAFSSLFVTTEKNKKTKTPDGPVVMRGSIERIAFLDGPRLPESEEESIAQNEASASPTPSSRDRLITGLRRAGLVSLLALAALVGLIFVLTRKR